MSEKIKNNNTIYIAPDEQSGKLIDITIAFWRSRCLYAATRLDIATHLSSGQKSIEELASLAKCNPDSLYRLLRALETIEIFKEVKPKVFENTPLSQLLGVGDDIKSIILSEGGDEQYKLWESIVDTVKTGKTRASEIAFGTISPWDAQNSNPLYQEDFKKSMSAMSRVLAPKFAAMADFSNFDICCDLGGSEGILMSEILKINSNIKVGINFDMEPVITNNERRKLKYSKDPRFKGVGGDFFNSVPEADCYILKFILHDWSDECCRQILEVVSKSIRPNGKIYIFDQIIDKNENPDYLHAVWVDTHMMQLLDGKERSKNEWYNLVKSTGFIVEQFVFPYLIVLSKNDIQ